MPGFVEELKRRNVVRVGAAYVIVAWITAQVAELALDSFEAPAWVMKVLLLTLALGLPIALFFAWAFELTPEGLKKEADVRREGSITPQTGHKLDRAIIVMLVVALAYFAADKFYFSKRADENVAVTPTSVADGADDAFVAAVNQRSVAVLPFVNMSPDPAKEYFSDGITEEIINAVVKIPGLSVPARTSVFGFKNHKGDVRKIGESLGVAHVLEGSVRSQDDQVRITAQLIKVENGFHLWSETFDRKLENIFAVQEEIAAAIAEQLVGKLGIEVDTVPSKTRNMAAYDTYLKGRAALREREDEAVSLLEQATEADPGFAPAWAALAIAYQSVSLENDKAIVAAEKALALDPNNVDALDAKGSALRHARRWLEAEENFDRALAIDPNSAELLEDYAEFLAHVGRSQEALVATSRGMEIEPRLGPLVSAHIEALLSNSRGDEAQEIMTRMLKENISGENYLWWWGSLPVYLNPSPETASLEDFPAPALPDDAPQWLINLTSLGSRILQDRSDGQAIEALKKLFAPERMVTRDQIISAAIARDLLIYAGETDLIIASDIASLEKPGFYMPEAQWTPFKQVLRKDPRFGEYLKLTGIIDYWDATEWPGWCQRDKQGLVSCQ